MVPDKNGKKKKKGPEFCIDCIGCCTYTFYAFTMKDGPPFHGNATYSIHR